MNVIIWTWIFDMLPTRVKEAKKTEWDRKKETKRLALCTLLCHSDSHLTFDCGNLSLHLHWLIFSSQVGSCHGIKFSCHYMGPPVLLLYHYPIALVRVYICVSVCVCVSMKKTPIQSLVLDRDSTRDDQSAFDQIMPSDHPLTLSSVHCRPKSHANTHIQFYMQCWIFYLFNYLSIRHVDMHTHSFVLIAMHTSPASNTSDLTFPSELHCLWHGLFPHVGFAASEVRTNFPCFTCSKLLSPCSLSHYQDCLRSSPTPQ